MRWPLAFIGTGIAVTVALLAWPQDETRLDSADLFPNQAVARVNSGEWSRALANRFVASSRAERPTLQTQDSPLESVSLIGTIEDERGGWALLMRAGELTTLAIGSEIDGYVLVELTPEEAVFERNGSRISIARAS
ncbi:unnamed protein product [Discosporangium mesarthrocarpum]